MINQLLEMAGAGPTGSLNIIAPLIIITPWCLAAFVVALPAITVWKERTAVVMAIDQDLSILLETLSTLAEAGLGFDAALDRVLESQDPNRPLSIELRTFREEVRAGRSRVVSFRHLAERANVSSLTSFCSALVQAEQTGGSVGGVLRDQAQDLRIRHRERALELATSLPVKLLVPMFVCFLPGIFVWALGPQIYPVLQFFNVATQNVGQMRQ
jgi:tight adherence protein C